MRILKSLLPMLLLACGMSAQNCQIFDLTASVVSVDPVSCHYFVVLDFQHNGTTNQFTVTGTGNNYGTFSYGQVPVTLGPFTAGTTINTLEFVATDLVFQDCQDVAVLTVPACGLAPCDISGLSVQTGNCGLQGLTYELWLNFDVANNPNTNNFFEVWTGNNVYLGLFPLSALPLHIPAFPWGNGAFDYIKVCINDSPDCCETFEFPAPDCVQQNPPCEIVDLAVGADSCTSDSTYRLKLNFVVVSPFAIDSFTVAANGTYFGTFGYNQLPLVIPNFPWNGGPADYVTVCTTNDVPCCKTKEFQVPTCLPIFPCGIQNLTALPGDCTSDSTFKLEIDFSVNDSTAVDSFNLWANGAFLGVFGMNQLPLTLDSFLWNNNVFNYIRICTGDAPNCCKELTFVAPDCLPFGPCEITQLIVQPGGCTSDSTYKVFVYFQATNPGNGTFTLWANGNVFGTYDLSAMPLMIPNFPSGPNNVGMIRVCINNAPGTAPCCREADFNAPNCSSDPCEIFDLVVDPGACNLNSPTYNLVVNFQVQNPGNGFFEVWAGNNIYLGVFPLNQLPLTIPNFPWGGGVTDHIRICINDHPDCCKELAFAAPDCFGNDCAIHDLSVETGDCTGDSTYVVHINFIPVNPLPGNMFSVWANGVFFGSYNLSQLPLTITNFPWNGGPNDVVRVCLGPPMNIPIGCCETKEFAVPDCLSGGDCLVHDITVETGDCNDDSTYHIVLNFIVNNPVSNTFSVWANGVFFGNYNLNQLPLAIPNFPWNGGPNDVIKVCFGNNPATPPTCCETHEFAVPDCFNSGDCNIFDMVVDPGDCTGNNTYSLFLNFQVSNPPSNTFGVWANGVFFGNYNLNQLPLTIPNFPWNGGPNDVVKVCFSTSGAVGCCETKEFAVPDCLMGDDCAIHDLVVETGDCTGDSSYHITVNFIPVNAPSDLFQVWANGVLFGTYNLSQLPLGINNFPWNGGPNDVIKICLVSNNSGVTCCETKEFPVPDCIHPGDCSISNLAVETGDCTSDSTYHLTLNFTVSNPPGNTFGVWANNVFLGLFNLSQLPLQIPNFPSNGGVNDVVKVCFGNAGIVTCCAIEEFPVPDCINQGGPCEIFDLVVDPGDCTSNTTYSLYLNFQVSNAPGNIFSVWANGVFFATYNLNQLPLNIPNFPWNGGPNDVVKVCFGDNIGSTACCAIKEFEVPDCLQNDPCNIYDLNVQHTGCLCGQFFAILTFQHQNGGNGGFDIVGNGTNYGNFPYNTQQPIILGPLNGDGTTQYEFEVHDHQFTDCQDSYNLGVIDCPVMMVDNVNGGGTVNVSPNPAGEWLNVNAQLPNGLKMGQTTVQVYQTDGKLALALTVAEGGNFQLDVSALPAAMYRLVLLSDAARLEVKFAKQ